jgi:Ca-activated chloride channel family protein
VTGNRPLLKIVFLFLAALAALGLPGRPQEKKQGLEYQLSVSAISIAVVVQGKDGRYINDLTQDDFTVYENEVKQTVSYFQHDFEAPVSLTILLDVSGSMGLQDKLKESREALRDFVDGLLRPQDEVSLLVFADGEVEVAAPFSMDKSGCLAELAKAEAYGQTALNDAVAVSPEFANRGKNEKRAILLITDGIENDSQASVDQAVEISRRVDVPIFTIGYKIPLSEEFLRKYKKTSVLTSAGIVSALERFSQATGGRLQVAADPRDLAAAFREIKRELGHQYIIGYTSYKSPKNEYRKIRVVTSNKKHKVRTREGY